MPRGELAVETATYFVIHYPGGRRRESARRIYGYTAAKHGVSAEQASEALVDPEALVFDPDYASRSGRNVRTIGWSTSSSRLLTVITVVEDGVVYGVNGWPANDADARCYRGDEHDE